MNVQPLVFFHIPKTAGSYVNECLRLNARPGEVVTHVESLRDQALNLALDSVLDRQIVSGHMSPSEGLAWARTRRARSLVSLRNPLAQTISHLNWVKAISHPGHADLRVGMREPTLRVAEALKAISLSDVDALRDLIRGDEHAAHFFDNCQTRYLGGPRWTGEVGVATYWVADAALAAMDHVILAEDVRTGLRQALRDRAASEPVWPADEIVNPARLHERPDLSSPRVRDFYEQITLWDRRLYQRAMARDQRKAAA